MPPANRDQSNPADEVVYFSLRLSSPGAFVSNVDMAFADADPEEAKFYQYLKQNDRIQSEFHTTLIHVNDRIANPQVWEKYEADYEEALRREDSGDRTPALGAGEAFPDHLVWDQGIMALAVKVDGEHAPLPCANANPHVTIGTANDSIKAYESNDLLKRWREGDQSKGPIQSKAFPRGYTFSGSVQANLAV